MKHYLNTIRQTVGSMIRGLKLTFRYLWEARSSRTPIGIEDPAYFDMDKGIMTLQYPYESLPVPDNGRYRLHNEIDDCIVCDKCAKICPVDCIEIDPIRSPEVFGVTSDGTPKRIHAARFDIDMSKCCFCGLCTTVCPTECLTMTKAYDFSEFDVKDHVYSFAEMSLVEVAQKRKELEAYEAGKKQGATEGKKEEMADKPAKPVFRPRPVPKRSEPDDKEKGDSGKPQFRPKPMIKRKPKDGDE